MTEEKEMLKIAEVAEYLGVSQTTIRKWMANRQFPQPLRLTKRTVYFLRNEINAWVDGKRIPTSTTSVPPIS